MNAACVVQGAQHLVHLEFWSLVVGIIHQSVSPLILKPVGFTEGSVKHFSCRKPSVFLHTGKLKLNAGVLSSV